ncbi:hypothetical protein M422DRAFT_226935 [Sphaerobolus stellatus SS14]|uniref:Linoleate 8R-lipoxygenase n=1 Tax=Sphaerobolus stellatus (strain SS14) TaxID=990650 RepID=A0A0C9USQ9_SPHS4|nr:hypothetical protein M422DRAFT_226935 [Sphaerobolus stellatus SS14]
MSLLDFTQSSLVQFADLIHLGARRPPKASDGYYDYEADSTVGSGQSDMHSRLYSIASGAQEVLKPWPPADSKLVAGVNSLISSPDAFDDRSYLFNRALYGLSRTPPGSLQTSLNNEVINILYNTVPHPPATYLGYQFRSADGSNNAIHDANIGKAGMPYARSVQSKRPQPANYLPDPGLVFDTLLKARDFKAHPGKNSSLTFAFAALVVHTLFRTDRSDWNINNTSSYLDLSPLYGYSQASQDQVRVKEKGRGLLYPDAFSEDRLGLFPPAASALLVIFSRNHNYIADMLLKINERKRWTNPPPSDPHALVQQDEEIFQTARLVNCGHFMAAIFGDYVAGFLGLGRDGNAWSMQPFDDFTTLKGDAVPRGQGNHVSVEFNLLYRWHATTSAEDIKWTEDLFKNLFGPDVDLEQVTIQDFKDVARKTQMTREDDPKTRTFGGIKRGADGKFSDDDLAAILQDATEHVAGSYRARGTPAALRVIEEMAMKQAREWGVCTMNEFRRYLKLKPFDDFEEWNPDPAIANAARQLYNHIENLELYPGLQAEQIEDLGPGSGICCGFTMTRAILGDAIALVRGDRFYTTDYTPYNLTSWGFQDCARDPNNGAFGAAIPKLLFRHLPRHYPANSAYGLFPFFVPDETKNNLTKLGVADNYDFARPKPQPVPKVLRTLTGIRYVFDDFNRFKVIYGQDMGMLTNGYGFFLTFDEEKTHTADKVICVHALFPDRDTVADHIEWYKKKTTDLIAEKSFSYDGVPGKYVDIVQNVINLVSVHWAADKLCGINLKTNANPHGTFTEQEVKDMFTILFTCVFENIQPEHGWLLRSGAQQVATIVNGIIEQSINEAAPTTLLGAVEGLGGKILALEHEKECYPFLRRLAKSGRPMKDMVACVIGLAVGSCMNYAQACTQVLDFYLDDARATERAALIEVCNKSDPESAELLRGYLREAMRLNPQFGGLFRAAVADATVPQGSGLPDLNVKAGDLLFASFKTAHLNPSDFPNPEAVDPTRPKESYQLQGAGFHMCPGVDFVAETLPEIIKIIFTLPGLRRAPGRQGVLASFIDRQFETDNRMYLTSSGNWGPWPGSLFVVYDS